MKNTKILKTYIDYGFGFPVKFLDAPMIKKEGEWTLNINFEKYERAVLLALSLKPSRLTGNEIKFIRNFLGMNLKSFGKRFGDVAHSAVIKWERAKDKPSVINWATEKDIRLEIVDSIRPKILHKVYSDLKEVVSSKSARVKIEPKDIKAA